MTAPASMIAPASTCADGSIWACGETTGFAGHRPRSRGRGEKQAPDQRESLLRARMDQNRNAGRRLAGKFGGTENRRGPQRLHQREVAFAVDEDKRMLAAFAGRRQGLDRYAGMAGIDKHRAGQIRDFAGRIPA